MTPEGAVLKAVCDLLAAERIPFWRMNTGAVKTENRFFRFGQKGMADIMAWMWNGFANEGTVLWIECKAENGRQSREQEMFEKDVTEWGMEYILARSSDDVLEALRRLRA